MYPRISQQQIDGFKPTRLYIKLHTETDLLYFGKSVVQDIQNYVGSGVRWLNHIKKHGKEHVITLWVSKWFTDPFEIQKFALDFSYSHDIVSATNVHGGNIWANLKHEDGLTGGPQLKSSYIINSELQRSEAFKITHYKTCEYCGWYGPPGPYAREHGVRCDANENRDENVRTRIVSYRQKMSIAKTNSEFSETCEHCGVTITKIKSNFTQWHGDNCRMNPNRSTESTMKIDERILKMSNTKRRKSTGEE